MSDAFKVVDSFKQGGTNEQLANELAASASL